jgi:hypothetical protein
MNGPSPTAIGTEVAFTSACKVRAQRLNAKQPNRSKAMKLNSTQVKQTLTQFEAEVLPENHPVVPQLHTIFGDHTFFLDDSGLNVLEPAEAPEMKAQAGEVVNLASWSDGTLTSLRPHEPEPTGVVILFESRH